MEVMYRLFFWLKHNDWCQWIPLNALDFLQGWIIMHLDYDHFVL